MGGPDFVQWHGLYEQRKNLIEMQETAEDMREKTARKN